MSIGLQNMPSGKMVTFVFFLFLDLSYYRCISLLQEHPKRDELLNVLIEAGKSAWARGAHEVIECSDLIFPFLTSQSAARNSVFRECQNAFRS